MKTSPDAAQSETIWQRMLHSTAGQIGLPLIAIAAGVFGGYLLAAFLGDAFPLGSPVALALEMVILIGVVTGFYLASARWNERRPVDELALPGAGWELLAGLGIGTALIGLVTGILWLLGMYQPEGWGGLGGLVPALAANLPSGFIQELAFRGVILRVTEERFGAYSALLIQALLFGLLHAAGDQSTPLGILAAAATAGALLGAAYLLTRRLWLPIGIHVAWDFAADGIFGLGGAGMIRAALSGPELLTGGAAGVEASVVSILVVSIACALLALRAWKKWGYE